MEGYRSFDWFGADDHQLKNKPPTAGVNMGIKMTFTYTPPTTPGFYAWRARSDVQALATTVLYDDLVQRLVAITDHGYSTLDSLAGEWCKLVPADEIQKAWIESYDDVIGIKGTALPTERWLKSRAKRVMEGLE